MRRLALLVGVAALAGCGGAAEHVKPKQPRLPRDLAQSWAQQSDAVAAALAAGDGCSARTLAAALQSHFIAAVNERRVPARLQEPLGSALNDLQGRITCAPPQPVVVERGKDRGKKWKKHEKKKHEKKKHGRDEWDD